MVGQDIWEYSSHIKETDVLLGIDYGEKKIGLAITSPNRAMAMPLAILLNNNIFITEIKKIISSNNIKGIVIGIPINMDGTYGPSAIKAKAFAAKLLQYTKLPIYMQDERRTSKAADSLLMIAGFNRKQRNNMDDSIAASLILESAMQALKNIKDSD